MKTEKVKTWRTPLTYIPSDGEKFEQPSLTVPNMVKPLDEMLVRAAQGFDLPKNNMDYTDEDTPLPRLKDFTDRDYYNKYVGELRDRILERIKQAQEPVKEEVVKGETNE